MAGIYSTIDLHCSPVKRHYFCHGAMGRIWQRLVQEPLTETEKEKVQLNE
jgi:hypothetical protein